MFVNLATQFDLEGIPIDYTTLQGMGLVYSYDHRDNVYYPRNGFFANISYNFFPSFLGNDQTSNTIEIDYNYYYGMKNKHDIVAARFYSSIGIGDLNFNQQSIVGKTDIRGYSQGEFRGDQLYALQAEYRWNLSDKFGLVGFAGIATIFKSINQEDDGRILPGAGGGFRINVFP